MRDARVRAVDHVIQSRLLIMQSKRLLLMSAERRATLHGTQQMRERLERLRSESEAAATLYRQTVLGLGSPAQPDYWPVAYAQLIQLGNRLAVKLKETAVTMPASERGQMTVDVRMLEQLVSGWTDSMRARIAAA